MSCSTRNFLKVFLWVFLLVGVIKFLATDDEAAANGGRKIMNSGSNWTTASKNTTNMGREKLQDKSKFDLNSASKRRVPNGPDPIHNRRSGNSRQPPGRA